MQGVRFKIGYNNDDFSTLPEVYITEFGRLGVKSNGTNLRGNKIGVRKKGAARAISHIRTAVFLKKSLFLKRFDELVLKAMVEEFDLSTLFCTI